MLSSRLLKGIVFVFAIIITIACASKVSAVAPVDEKQMLEVKSDSSSFKLGIARFSNYLPLLRGKRVGVIANHTARIDNVHLVDTLLALGVKIKYVFAPEHGFRGDADAGAEVKDGLDPKTGLPLFFAIW